MSLRGQLMGPSCVLVALFAVAGCGGSSKQTSTTTTTTHHGIPALPTTTGTATISTTTTSTTATVHRVHHHANVHHQHPGAPPPTTTTHGSSAPAARVPATYAIAASGALSPPSVSAPSGYDVQVTFVSHSSKTDTVVINLKTPLNLVVPAGGKTFAFLKKPSKGSYAIDVNGHKAGTLVIGAAPGP